MVFQDDFRILKKTRCVVETLVVRRRTEDAFNLYTDKKKWAVKTKLSLYTAVIIVKEPDIVEK